MKQWRLLKEHEYRSPHWNLAVEEAIPRAVEQRLVPNTLRLWRNKNTIIIGRFQCPRLEVVFNSCLKYRTAILRRFTGGGTVYHDEGNLNLAVSVYKYPWASSTLCARTFFKKVGLTVVKTLRNLGIPAKFNKMNVYVADRKLSGLAGMVTKGSMFVHGSLLVNSNLEILSHVLNSDQDRAWKKFVRSVPKKVTTLKDELDREIEMSEVEETLVDVFEEEFKSVFVQGELTRGELKLAETLCEEKYSRPQWILSTCEGCPEIKMDAPILMTLAFREPFFSASG